MSSPHVIYTVSDSSSKEVSDGRRECSGDATLDTLLHSLLRSLTPHEKATTIVEADGVTVTSSAKLSTLLGQKLAVTSGHAMSEGKVIKNPAITFTLEIAPAGAHPLHDEHEALVPQVTSDKQQVCARMAKWYAGMHRVEEARLTCVWCRSVNLLALRLFEQFHSLCRCLSLFGFLLDLSLPPSLFSVSFTLCRSCNALRAIKTLSVLLADVASPLSCHLR